MWLWASFVVVLGNNSEKKGGAVPALSYLAWGPPRPSPAAAAAARPAGRSTPMQVPAGRAGCASPRPALGVRPASCTARSTASPAVRPASPKGPLRTAILQPRTAPEFTQHCSDHANLQADNKLRTCTGHLAARVGWRSQGADHPQREQCQNDEGWAAGCG